MYLSFYNLREFPFAITCDDRFFYESAVHAEALANMMYTVQQRKGMVLVKLLAMRSSADNNALLARPAMDFTLSRNRRFR